MRRRGIGAAIAVVLLAVSVAAMVLVGPGVIDRVAHPGRYATSGQARLAPQAYVAAARLVMPRGDRVRELLFPGGRQPVIVSTASVAVYLDPPTARVLDVRTAPQVGMRPITGAQPVAGVIARARPYGGGEPLRRVDWPTRRSPDWTVTFGDADAVKVADDSGTARAAPVRQGATLTSRLPDAAALSPAARATILCGAVVVAIGALLWIAGAGRVRRSGGPRPG